MATTTIINDTFGDVSGWIPAWDWDHVTYSNAADMMKKAAGSPGNLSLEAAVLFFWVDGGPFTRSMLLEKVYSGLPPLTIVGVRAASTWSLLTGDFKPFMTLVGDNIVDMELPNTGFNFFSIGKDLTESSRESLAYVRTNGAGQLAIRCGGRNVHPSGNILFFWHSIEIFSFSPIYVQGHIITPRTSVVVP
jgi:hypothetical protein